MPNIVIVDKEMNNQKGYIRHNQRYNKYNNKQDNQQTRRTQRTQRTRRTQQHSQNNRGAFDKSSLQNIYKKLIKSKLVEYQNTTPQALQFAESVLNKINLTRMNAIGRRKLLIEFNNADHEMLMNMLLNDNLSYLILLCNGKCIAEFLGIDNLVDISYNTNQKCYEIYTIDAKSDSETFSESDDVYLQDERQPNVVIAPTVTDWSDCS